MDAIEKSMEIIANAGEGKSYGMLAIQQARASKYEEAEEIIYMYKEKRHV